MKHKLIFTLPLLVLLACSDDATVISEDTVTKNEESASKEHETPDAETSKHLEAKAWIESTMKDYFKEDMRDFYKPLTPRMKSYWDDQMETVYGDLSVDDFNERWEKIYDVKNSTRETGLFIDAQDNGPMRLLSCRPVGRPLPNKFNFVLKLRDDLFKSDYTREVTVIPVGSSFLIDEVKVMK